MSSSGVPKPRVAVLDIGGNLASVVNAVRKVGGEPIVWKVALEPPDQVTHMIIPGQGRFHDTHLPSEPPSIPTLGICLGMQLMCESSEEAPDVPGLGWLPYRVEKLPVPKLPHIGWAHASDPTGIRNTFYFCHSYAIPPVRKSTAWVTEYQGYYFTSALFHGKLWAVQFHPEKSGKAGLSLLRQFLAL